MGQRTPTFDDTEARLLVEQGDVEQAMRLVHDGMRRSVCLWLHRCFPTLTTEDLADAWGATLYGILRSIQTGRYDTRRPLVSWVCRIAYNRAAESVRRAATRKKTQGAATAALQRSRSSRPWINLDGIERAEVIELVRAAIALLPEKQQVVLQVLVDHYPESGHLEVLQREVSLVTGHPETMASIKRALQEGRVKVRAHLRKRGYAPEATRDDA